MDAASLPNRWWLRVQKAGHTGRQMGDKFVLEDAQITKCRQWLVSPGVHNRSRYPYLIILIVRPGDVYHQTWGGRACGWAGW